MTRSYPEPLRVTGPLPSLVLRTEDVWQRYNHFHRSARGSQSGFPLLTPIMETYDGPAWRLIATSYVANQVRIAPAGGLVSRTFQSFAFSVSHISQSLLSRSRCSSCILSTTRLVEPTDASLLAEVQCVSPAVARHRVIRHSRKSFCLPVTSRENSFYFA